MSDLLSRRLALLGERANLPLLTRCLHGIERECLRVDGNGQLALTPHSPALGSALTHAQITTDYSESLLEFITPAEVDPAKTLADLEKIHRFTLDKLGDELLWSPSMPCRLPAEEDRRGDRDSGPDRALLRHRGRPGEHRPGRHDRGEAALVTNRLPGFGPVNSASADPH